MSIDEINDRIDSFVRIKEQEMKFDVLTKQIQAQQIVEAIARSLDKENSDTKYRNIWDYYPTLFSNEKHAHDIEEKKNEIEKVKADRYELARRVNAKFKRGENN